MRKVGYKKIVSQILRSLEPFDRWEIINNLRRKRVESIVIAENEKIESAPPIIMNWPDNIKKPLVGLVKSEIGPHSYWPKFKRFLEHNNIPYEFIDIGLSTFISDVQKYDVIVWRTLSSYSGQWEATDKIEFIQDYLGKLTLPNKESLWFYEDKLRQQWLFDYYNLPSIKTFISHNKNEVKNFINSTAYPFISKDRTSSSSEGVKLVRKKKLANKLQRKIFSNGMPLYEKYVRQKDYVLIQEAVPNYGFDLRVIMVGNSYFGYYRFPREGDFKASGSGITEKTHIPLEVLKLAKNVRENLPKSYLLAVDFLQDNRDQNYYIIETSIFVGIESCEQLVVDGVPGRYIEENGKFNFQPGRFWLQELMMEELMRDWILKNS